MPTPADPPPFRCSDAARERLDPMRGTAPPQARFLLVEQETGWAFDGFASAPLPEDLRAEVARRTTAVGGRVMLVRRPGRQSSSVCSMRSWCVVDTGAPAGERVTWGTWAYPADLLAACDRLEELDRAARRPGRTTEPAVAPAAQTAPEEVLVLVCTHGRKDVCCAVRGRPVAQDLSRRWPEQVWECSHTGGDRFAANVLVLPDGATYGGLDPARAAGVIEAHLAGRPDTAFLRGVAGLSRPVQAAVVAVHEQLGPQACGTVEPLGTRPLEPEGLDVAATLVRLRTGDGRVVEVAVREHLREPARLTCQAGAPKASQVPVAGDVRVVVP